LGKIYTQEEIDKAKQSPGFDREYGLQYLGKVGNVFSEVQILKAMELGDKYKHLPVNYFTIHSIGVDIGFGSSSTAIVATEYLKKQSKISTCHISKHRAVNEGRSVWNSFLRFISRDVLSIHNACYC
jgi:hypothetical protein